ncbi:hypothetical protein ACLB2K_077610 [Fragaria x ananassa]
MCLLYENQRSLDLDRWHQACIVDAIDLSFQLNSQGANRVPMMAVASFWDTASNTFNFRFGQKGITLLDLYDITRFPITENPCQEKDYQDEVVAFEVDPHRKEYCKSYEAWANHYFAQGTEQSALCKKHLQ